ncbi:fasciclin domain-containing protein [Pedobacter mucosus]|uniref:fasciclin domain-containing protein n=1 Tax=Pedobacter mucosus TaxID=2895286 RepID=UPI001EE3ED9D|nr:fasciclin domain-containing protein [Pedobacter mucosus]UKT65206.1 fasciclin domain-containing protein [Pedobacter mucosus]
MTKFKIKHLVLGFLLSTIVFVGCKKAWEEHNAIDTPRLNLTLFEQISGEPGLSTFTAYLVKTGYDKVLGSSKSFTVWAPNNDALKNIDATILNDTAVLKRFVGNHITNQSYFTSAPKPSLVIRMMNGKNTIFTKTTFEQSAITSADVYVKNGVLHVVNAAATPKPNAWEYLQTLGIASAQKDFIKGLEFIDIDTSRGVLLYKDPVTQKGVYQEGSTFKVSRNKYFQRVANISSEDSLVTYIILNNTVFQTEKNKLAAFNKNIDPLKADTLAKWSVVKDLVVNKVYNINELPDSMTTVTGVKIHIDKNAIVETRLLSNGIAYVVNNIGYKVMENKIPTLIIQGEFPDSLRSSSAPIARIKEDPNGKRFTDFQTGSITSSPSPLNYFRYKTNANSVKYEVYLRAINDILTTSVSVKIDFNSNKGFGDIINPLPTVGYYAIPSILGLSQISQAYRDAYREVYMGTYTAENYGDLYLFLASSLGASATAPTALTIDYIKLKPVN